MAHGRWLMADGRSDPHRPRTRRSATARRAWRTNEHQFATRQAASEFPQFEQNREAGASTVTPQWSHLPRRYLPHEEQNAGSGSGRGPHVSHERRTVRYFITAASAASTIPATPATPKPCPPSSAASAGIPLAASAAAPSRARSSTSAVRVYSVLSAA